MKNRELVMMLGIVIVGSLAANYIHEKWLAK